MKIYSVREPSNEEDVRYGGKVFEWTRSDGVIKVCIQKKLQQVLFFEELLREAGYRRDGELQVSTDNPCYCGREPCVCAEDDDV